MLFASPALIHAEGGVTGTWRLGDSGAPLLWEMNLVQNGQSLTGSVSSCSGQKSREISAGKADGDGITFQCTSEDGQRTINFAGKVTRDDVTIKWSLIGIRSVNNATGWDRVFGFSAPREFTAKRLPALGFDRILHADREPQNWLTYSGNVRGHRHSLLDQITPMNVRNLELAWIWQAQVNVGVFEATPLVVDGVLYTVQPPNDVVALNASTGRVLWTYPYRPLPRARASGGGGEPNRGLAILGNALFIGTLDAHLLAINAHNGTLLWNTTVANANDPACRGGLCYVITHAPLVVKDKVIVGVAGGEGPIRGFIAAFDSNTGKEVWRFNTVPAAGEPGNETWSGDSWKTGGAGVWNIGAYDADLNLTYWGTGNPYPVTNGATRLGDNLYSESVVALEADTGTLKWHYQFTPHDTMDWDATQVPVLTDMQWQGRSRKVMLWANRNGLMYVLDRTTGEFLLGKPFVEINWMKGFDGKGRPIVVQDRPMIGTERAPVLPGSGTLWQPPSYSPTTSLFYIPSTEGAQSGLRQGSVPPGYGAVRAFNPSTGEKEWEFRRNDAFFGTGVLTTASNLLFTGATDGYFYALDARTGQRLWQMSLTGRVTSGPMTFAVGGKQYIAVAADNTLFAFALRQ
jgi:alcohol dehydrogenase (cytochrome c)